MNAPPTTPAGLPLNSTSTPSSSSLPKNTYVSSSSGTSYASSASSRLGAVMNVLRPPLKFYATNTLVGSAVLGVGMSVGQRLICGKKQTKVTDKKNH